MKTRALKNYSASVGVEAYDIDWNNLEETNELGRLCSTQCVVFVDTRDMTSITQLTRSMNHWGDPAGGFVNGLVASGKLTGRHWRDYYASIARTVHDLPKELHKNVVRVTYRKDENNQPTGIFAAGELDWHCDSSSFDDIQRIIALASVEDTKNSQTQFLCTHDAYESLSADMKSTVKELTATHKWFMGVVAPGCSLAQQLIAMYNSVPVDGMETRLYSETVSGLPGLQLPTHSFNGFVGMSKEESKKILKELYKHTFKEKYIYTQNWEDGQVVFMDQEITLHKRPTNVSAGNKRLLNRIITYLNKLYPDHQPETMVRVNGQILNFDEFAMLVDQRRKEFFKHYQDGGYASSDLHVFPEDCREQYELVKQGTSMSVETA